MREIDAHVRTMGEVAGLKFSIEGELRRITGKIPVAFVVRTLRRTIVRVQAGDGRALIEGRGAFAPRAIAKGPVAERGLPQITGATGRLFVAFVFAIAEVPFRVHAIIQRKFQRKQFFRRERLLI